MAYTVEKNTYKKAKKRVKKIEGFYNHLQLFIVLMVFILVFYDIIIAFFESYKLPANTLEWVKINIFINASFWFIGLVIHWFIVFKQKVYFLDTWEKNKIREFMSKNN
jgi:hypothetical protein